MNDEKQKQIEEMAKVIEKMPWRIEQGEGLGCRITNNIELAEYFYDAGYHKQSEWIPVSNPPKEDVRVNVWLGNNKYNDLKIDTDRMHNGEWVRWRDCVTHWMPLNVQEPQKGGE